jgi:radical SAM superfamily enzyme YgiQ (UPF0313 family)
MYQRILDMPSIILTADSSLMLNPSEHIYQSYLTCFPASKLLEDLIKRAFTPISYHVDGGVKLAPLSIRVLESILYRSDLKNTVVRVIHPKDLGKFITQETKIVGISVIDPLGQGPIPSTLSFFLGGEPYLKLKFEEMLLNLRLLKNKFPFKIVVGGPGAWQLADQSLTKLYNIDYVIVGEAEKIVSRLFYDVLTGQAPEDGILFSEVANPEEVPPIMKPTIGGLIEVSRGCTRKCEWCYSTMVSHTGTNRMRFIPADTIKKSAYVNAVVNNGSICLQSDDILLYGSKGFYPEPEVVLSLLEDLHSIREVKNISFLHFSFSSIASSPETVAEITKFLDANNLEDKIIQIGLETGSVKLLKRHMPGKALPFKPEEWHEVVIEGSKILSNNRWYSIVTLILGFPDEEPEDVKETEQLIHRLGPFPLIFIPLFFTPIKLRQARFPEQRLHEKKLLIEHIRLLSLIEKHNIKIIGKAPSKIKRLFSCFQKALEIGKKHFSNHLNYQR